MQSLGFCSGMFGQVVNFDKSLIYFSGNFTEESKKHIGDTLAVGIASNLEKYLGLPTMVGRRKKEAFVDTREKIIKRMKAWSIRNLFIEGKEVSIKSISIYAMRCFLLPNSFCHELESLMGRFCGEI